MPNSIECFTKVQGYDDNKWVDSEVVGYGVKDCDKSRRDGRKANWSVNESEGGGVRRAG